MERIELDQHARKEIATDLWRKFMLDADRMVISMYDYAIQVTIFPPSGKVYSAPDAPNAVHMTIEDDGRITEHRV